MAEVLPALHQSLASRYRLDREIGRGGTSVVYAAWDVAHSRNVAIKVLRPEIPEAIGADRFSREIRIASGLNHPGIMPLLDSGEVAGRFYYVMPLIQGESLRDRLQREKQLPVEEAIRIARDVAAALEHAHSHGVVHRDVKPPNILLDGARTIVADFGLARALPASAFARDESLSTSGLVFGTVLYMAPEQAGGQAVDARADVYGLGCVLYEMLVGEPPFPGTDATAVLARHMSQPVASVRIVRRGVPPHVDAAVLRALEKSPSDRFASAAEFSEALSHVAERRAVPPPPARVPFHLVVVGGVLAGLVLTAYGLTRWQGLPLSSAALRPDSSVYAVLPVVHGAAVPRLADEDQLLMDALERWSGLRPVERFQLRDALAKVGVAAERLTTEQAAGLSRSVGAGRFIRVELSLASDSLRVRAVLYDAAGSGKVLRQATIRGPPTALGLETAIQSVVDQLLFPEGAGGVPLEPETRSLPARQAFARGESAFGRWEFDAADSGFAAALSFDERYVRASVWLALVRVWRGQPPPHWRLAAEHAVRDSVRLPAAERSLVPALAAQARGDIAKACFHWRGITTSDSLRFIGWYGLANCLVEDDAVVRDRRSGSAWAFRSSYRDAVAAYRRAFEISPSVLGSLRGGGFFGIQDLLFTRGTHRRIGHATAPDTGAFLARPSWDGDTLAFVPYRALDVYQGQPGTLPPTLHIAIAKQREVFFEIASAWRRASGGSDAMEALAISLQLLGHPAALDSFRRARAIAHGPEDRLRIGAAEAWYRVQLALPHDTTGLRSARALIDTLLRSPRTGGGTDLMGLASLAALTGRGHLSARLLGEAASAGHRVLPWPIIAEPASKLLTYSALGGPADSILLLRSRTEDAIARSVPVAERDAAWLGLLARSATLAIPSLPPEFARSISGAGYPLLEAMVGEAKGNRDAVSTLFERLRSVRQPLAPEDLTIDALYPEAWLLGRVGRLTDAAAWLDPWLRALPRVAPGGLGVMPEAAVLVPAMAFRARLAIQLGDRATAIAWARAVEQLWSDPDSHLKGVSGEMRDLVHGRK